VLGRRPRRPGVLAHRAVTTLDAMVGRRPPAPASLGQRHASTTPPRVPARLTALAVARTAPLGRRCGASCSAARQPPSPNAGVAEPPAAALDVHLRASTATAGRSRPASWAMDPPRRPPTSLPPSVWPATSAGADGLAGVLELWRVAGWHNPTVAFPWPTVRADLGVASCGRCSMPKRPSQFDILSPPGCPTSPHDVRFCRQPAPAHFVTPTASPPGERRGSLVGRRPQPVQVAVGRAPGQPPHRQQGR
jgi:hypothetical protein